MANIHLAKVNVVSSNLIARSIFSSQNRASIRGVCCASILPLAACSLTYEKGRCPKARPFRMLGILADV